MTDRYKQITTIARVHQEYYIDSLKLKVDPQAYYIWLLLMGLVETWDLINDD